MLKVRSQSLITMTFGLSVIQYQHRFKHQRYLTLLTLICIMYLVQLCVCATT